MTTKSLPMVTIDKNRKSFGQCRTKCACRECSIACEHMPGMLVPDDIPIIYEATKHSGEHLMDWADRSLLASPGALVGDSSTGRTFRIQTLVPARQPGTTKCIHLTADGKCGIHEIAPYGCAFADSHMTRAEGDAVVMHGLRAVADALHSTCHYTLILAGLKAVGKVTPPPEVSRAAIAEAYKKELAHGA